MRKDRKSLKEPHLITLSQILKKLDFLLLSRLNLPSIIFIAKNPRVLSKTVEAIKSSLTRKIINQ